MPGRKFPESFSIKKKSSELKEHPRPDEEVSEKDNKIQKISNTQLNDVVKTFELYIISGVQVNFPFKAYACQLNMMQKVLFSKK